MPIDDPKSSRFQGDVFNPQPKFHRPYISNPEKGPLIVVGIDGTLAPLRTPYAEGWNDWSPLPGAQVEVPFSVGLGNALSGIEGEIVFCSDWGTRSSLFTDAYGWDDVWSLRRQSPSRWWWKLEAVRMFLGSRPRRPVVWFDDEFHRFPEASSWALRSSFPVLLLETDPRLGIQPDDVKEAQEFCKKHALFHQESHPGTIYQVSAGLFNVSAPSDVPSVLSGSPPEREDALENQAD